MEYSEAILKMVEHIQKGGNYPEAYALMIADFISHKEDGETNKMAVVAAIDGIADTKRPDKPRKAAKRFTKPDIQEVAAYFHQQGSLTCNDDAEAFFDFYDKQKDWKVGKTKMKCWKASVRNWMRGKKKEYNNGATGMLGTDITDLMPGPPKSDSADALDFMEKSRIARLS